MPLSMPADFKSDGIHPNDNGFKIMAKWWWVAIEYASRENLIKTAPPFSGVTGNTCEKVAGQETYGGITQKGSGTGDGIYYHNSNEMGSIWSYTSEFDRDQVSHSAPEIAKSKQVSGFSRVSMDNGTTILSDGGRLPIFFNYPSLYAVLFGIKC